MPRTDMSKQCKHLESLGEHEAFSRGRRESWQVTDKGFRCAISKFPPHATGPKLCVPRKRQCFEARDVEEAEAEAGTAAEPEVSGENKDTTAPSEGDAE